MTQHKIDKVLMADQRTKLQELTRLTPDRECPVHGRVFDENRSRGERGWEAVGFPVV